MKFKPLPRDETGKVVIPKEREGMWIALAYVDVSLEHGILESSPSKSNSDPMLYNVSRKVTALRKAYLNLALECLKDDGDPLKVVYKQHRIIKDFVMCGLDGVEPA